jgi:quinol-cytochrome oxidoreductase complex cytochrome b subunit
MALASQTAQVGGALRKRPSFFHHLHPPRIPAMQARFRYTFGLGGISLYMFVILLITGALELFYYVPSPEAANATVQQLTYLVPFGWLIRGLHYWAAQVLLATVTLHMIRIVLTGSYRPPRRFNWLLGVILLLSVLLLDFTGYVLRWDADIAWALLVGTNLLKSIPIIGYQVYVLIVGGAQVGPSALVRFYSWHIFGLALPASLIIGWHLFRVRRDGGISHPSQAETSAGSAEAERTISRDQLVDREALAALIATISLLLLALILRPPIRVPLDLGNPPPEAMAPWFFRWIQQLLRFGDPFLMGIVLPMAVLALLALLPYLIDREVSGSGQWFNRAGRAAQAVILALAACITTLTIWSFFS